MNELITHKFLTCLRTSKKDKDTPEYLRKDAGVYLIMRGGYNHATDGDRQLVVIGDRYSALPRLAGIVWFLHCFRSGSCEGGVKQDMESVIENWVENSLRRFLC